MFYREYGTIFHRRTSLWFQKQKLHQRNAVPGSCPMQIAALERGKDMIQHLISALLADHDVLKALSPQPAAQSSKLHRGEALILRASIPNNWHKAHRRCW